MTDSLKISKSYPKSIKIGKYSYYNEKGDLIKEENYSEEGIKE